MATHLILLAAGEGSRMQSDRPKVLHEIAGAPLFAHALNSACQLDGLKVMVVGHGGDAVARAARHVDSDLVLVLQEEQRGTAHAVNMAAPNLQGAGGDTLVLYGDTPFVRAETVAEMQALRDAGADIVYLGVEVGPDSRFGRLVMDDDRLERIVEWKDADEAERALPLGNSGVMLADTELLLRLAASVGNDNAAGEFYLTDIAAIARAEGRRILVATCPEAETLGINTRAELARAEALFQSRARVQALENGVTLQAPDTVHFAFDTHIGRDAVIEPNVVFGPGVTVESHAHIRAFSHLEGCHVGAGAVIGPYARLRPGAELSNDVKIGNFVEVKNATIAYGAKVNHLSYIGDAEIGAGSNIGAGTITCNYDGVFKHKTTIGENVFIGSNTMLVAPVSVGDESMTATGSVITRDVPQGALAVARARQEIKPNFAKKFFQKLREAKAARKG